MRLFIAMHFSEPVKERLYSAMQQLKSQAVSANLTRPENLHLTLAFIGESTRVAPIREAIREADPPLPLMLSVGGAGRFGDLWWVGIEENPALTRYALRLQDTLRSKGFPIEKRDFRPHITIARQVVSKSPIRLSVPCTAMTVGHVSLMKSERIRGKLTYTEIYRHPSA